MVAGALLVLFWAIVALIGAFSALAFLMGMKGAGL
jgi:hypothetical protein